MKLATNASAGAATSSSRRPDLEHLPLGDHTDAVGERGRVLEVVGDEDRRQAEVAQQLLQLGADVGARVRVERGHRLVQEQDRGVARERTRERDALALAAGELRRPRLREVRDAGTGRAARPRAPARRSRRSASTERCGKSA